MRHIARMYEKLLVREVLQSKIEGHRGEVDQKYKIYKDSLGL